MSGVRVLVGTRKGRVRPDLGWEAREMGGERAAFCRLGDLSRERIAGGSEPDLRVADSSWFGQIIQRSDDGGKTWFQPGLAPGEPTTGPDGMPKGESNKFVYDVSPETGKPLTTHTWYDGTQHPWEFKRVWHLEPSLTDPESRLCGRGGRGAVRIAGRRPELERVVRITRSWDRAEMAAGRGRDVSAFDFARSEKSAANFHRDLGGGRVSHRRWRQDLEADQSADCIRNTFPIRTRRSAIAFTTSRCIRRGPTRSSCKSIGTSCGAMTRAIPGAR